MTLKFEDFLDDPSANLEDLCGFCGIKADPAQIRELCGHIKAERRYAYLKDPEACRVFGKFQNHPLVTRLGYGSEAAVPESCAV